MTPHEAQRLARIFGSVDNGCLSCVAEVCRKASAAGFGFDWKPDGAGRTDKGVVRVHVWRAGEDEPEDEPPEPEVLEVDVPR